MQCLSCGSANVAERLERTAQGYRRFRCRECGRQFNERTAGVLNRTQYPSDIIALVVLWRLRYRLTLRDLSEMFLVRGLVFSYEAVREWGAQAACRRKDSGNPTELAKTAAVGGDMLISERERARRKLRSSSWPRQNRPAETMLPKPRMHRIRPLIPR
jgi:hypothetical protein